MARLKVFLTLTVVAAVALTAFAVERNVTTPVARPITGQNPSERHQRNGLDEVIYYEDFEDGITDWTAIDNTAAPASWHIDDYSAFDGTCWWSGDSTVGPNGGYLDDWYMVLDSPPIQLGATSSLRFMHRFSVEVPGGEPAGYNGWDGMNIRISVNNGQTWTVIPGNVVSPTYSRTSLYSFGFQHGEGVGIPGWAGTGTTWTQVTADLTAWANQSVKIRWAFASDPSFSTPDSPGLFGWMVDNIRVHTGTDTVFSDNCNVPGQWSRGTNVPAGGQLWRTAQDAGSPAGPTHLVCNNPGSNQYNPNMNNEIISPLIDCSGRGNGQLMADFVITGSLPACDAFPDCDYWGCQLSVDSGRSWSYASNPCEDPNGNNYVYVDTPPSWASFNASYANPIDLTCLLEAGGLGAIRLKWTMETNADATFDVGPKIDSVTVVYNAGFPNDVSCYTLQVKYPNVVNRPTRLRAYFSNPGQNAQGLVQGWTRVRGVGGNIRLLPNMSLDPGATATRDTVVNFSTVGTFTLDSWALIQGGGDENLENDSSHCRNVVTQAATEDWEIGYDNRHDSLRFLYQTGNGTLTKYTVVSDGVVPAGGTFNLNEIRTKFDGGQTTDLPIRLHIYRGGTTAPGTEIYNQVITVGAGEVGAVWKVVDVSSDTDTRSLNQDFWVWWEVTSTSSPDYYPELSGDYEQLWSDRHFYTWTGTGAPTTSPYFYNCHARLALVTAADDQDVLIPATWSLEQNYPNPFNPTTEITYSVPRAEQMTLKIFNLLGEEVATLFDGVVQVGQHTVTFDGANVASGVYMYKLESASFTATHKMVLMK
jgi:hypothetical protein